MNTIERSMEIIEAAKLSKPQEQFVTGILSLLASKLSRLGPPEREQMLKEIEDNKPRQPKEPLRITLSENARRAIALKAMTDKPTEEDMRAILRHMGFRVQDMTREIIAAAFIAHGNFRHRLHEIKRTALH